MARTDELLFAKARDADCCIIADLAREYVEHGLRHAWTAQRVRQSMRRPETLVLTARVPAPPAQKFPSRGCFAGFAIMDFGDERAHLNLLAVAPAFRRRGVARALVEWLEESARTAGIGCVTLEVRATNHAAQRLYAGLGFEPVTRLPGYYQGLEDAIRLRHDLRSSGEAAPPLPPV